MNTQHIAAVTVLLAAAVVPVADADTIYVDANCPGGDGSVGDPYCSIQTAIDNAVDGDEIVVAPGTYFETINFLGKAIWLHSSDGAEVTTIDGQQMMGSIVTCDSGEGLGTVLDGFTLTGGTGTDPGDGVTDGGGMYNLDSSPTVTSCTFTENEAFVGGGMYNTSSSPTVIDCTFNDNSAIGRGGGMYNFDSSPTVTNCTITGNTADFGGGMYNHTNSNPMVTRCTFSANTAGQKGGGMYNSGSSPTVIGCTFSGNGADGGFLDYGGGGGMWSINSDLIVADCTFRDNAVSNAGGAMTNFAGSPTVERCRFEGNSAPNRGGGIVNIFSSPTISSCTFGGNAAGLGGGMYNHAGQAVVTDCTFSENTAGEGGGMGNRFVLDMTVTGCTFTGNSAGSGGGMANRDESHPIVADCVFIGNTAVSYGGGMLNTASGPDSFEGPSNPTLSNCTFVENSASFGGGIANYASGSTVTNCTFIANQEYAMWNMGECWGFVCFVSSPVLENSLLQGNLPSPLLDDGFVAESTVRYCNVQGGWPGTGNIDADPMFVDPDNGDYRLQAGSPCIDAGNNNAIVNLTDTDLDGNPRFADDPDTDDTGCGVPVVVDMGAYEYQGMPAEVVFADLDGDGVVGVADLMILNGCVGSSDPNCCIADLDLDGVVGMSDRILVWASMIEFSPVR